MNPNSPQPGFELPTPQPSGDPESVLSTKEAVSIPGTNLEGNAGNSLPGTTAAAAPLASQDPLGLSVPTIDPAQTSTPSVSPVIADDSDLIEKEWVQKAKQIVMETKEDPYRQNNEINKFKADYLKKRYDKDIKVEES